MEYYLLEIPGRPVPKANVYRARIIKKGPKPYATIYTTAELENYEMMVGQIASEVIPQTIEGLVSVYVRVYQHGKRWIDIDNAFKGILDGIDASKVIKKGKQSINVCSTGIENDKYVQLIVGERVHVNFEEEQRVEVIITEYKGLFHLTEVLKHHYDIGKDYHADLIYPELKKG